MSRELTPHGLKVLSGQALARALGKQIGRPRNPKMTPEVLDRARAMRAAGVRLREVAASLQVPLSTLHRALFRETEDAPRYRRAEVVPLYRRALAARQETP